MLIGIESGRTVDQVPLRRDFDPLRGRFSEAEFAAMVGRINEFMTATRE